VDEVRERALAVDLDDRKQLAVPGLQRRVAADVDLLVVERELRTGGLDHAPRGGAEVATLGVEEDDLGYGYNPRVIVASPTRWTARPYAAIRIVVSRDS
jgi:hypothetical protein